MIVLRTPKGWTGPKEVDGLPVEGTFRSHQVPLSEVRSHPTHLTELEAWMRSYRPEELFDADGSLKPEIAALSPGGDRRMSANPHANGGLFLRDLSLPDFWKYGLEVAKPGTTFGEATKALGGFLRDVIVRTSDTFRLFRPDRDTLEPAGAVLRSDGSDLGRGTSAPRPIAPEGNDGSTVRASCQGAEVYSGPVATVSSMLRSIPSTLSTPVQSACQMA